MSCCTCETPCSVGCYSACGTVTLPFNAPDDGTYQIIWIHAGTQRSMPADAVRGQPFTFSAQSIFPENTRLVFQIIRPDGNPLIAPDGSVCFSLRTVLSESE